MSTKEIEYLMQSISDLHSKLSAKGYQLTSLDQHTIKNLLEQLHLKILTTDDHYHAAIPSQVIPQPAIETKKEPVADTKQIQQMNDELEGVFTQQPKAQIPPKNTSRDSFQLGINERIMFAKELFDDDVATLQESIRKLKSFETKDEAIQYFENTFAPFLIDEGKDEEIIQEFQQILHRIY